MWTPAIQRQHSRLGIRYASGHLRTPCPLARIGRWMIVGAARSPGEVLLRRASLIRLLAFLLSLLTITAPAPYPPSGQIAARWDRVHHGRLGKRGRRGSDIQSRLVEGVLRGEGCLDPKAPSPPSRIAMIRRRTQPCRSLRQLAVPEPPGRSAFRRSARRQRVVGPLSASIVSAGWACRDRPGGSGSRRNTAAAARTRCPRPRAVRRRCRSNQA
jgi:hypothetical protein